MAIRRASSNENVTVRPNNTARVINTAEQEWEWDAISQGIWGREAQGRENSPRAASGEVLLHTSQFRVEGVGGQMDQTQQQRNSTK